MFCFRRQPQERPDDGEGELAMMHLRPRRGPPEVPGPGLRRDRTATFARMRAVRAEGTPVRAPKAVHSVRMERPVEPMFEELQSIYCEVSQVQNSLASQLAQHRGLLQFSTDFEHRAPPLELRILLPQLEAAIEQLLETLQVAIAKLGKLDLDAGAGAALVRDALQGCLVQARCDCSTTFDEQRLKLRERHAASPLLSPLTCPHAVLGKRLAAALGSPSLSSVTTASPSTTSVASPPERTSAPAACGSPPERADDHFFTLDGLLGEDEEKDACARGGRPDACGPEPFSCIFGAEDKEGSAQGGRGPVPFSCVFAATSDGTPTAAFR